uniref:Uncharacterized protein n=1 Tax=Sphaerodactylus townsendi TaxID=933632 RepID=A0ACB8EJJ2_9SAUR
MPQHGGSVRKNPKATGEPQSPPGVGGAQQEHLEVDGGGSTFAQGWECTWRPRWAPHAPLPGPAQRHWSVTLPNHWTFTHWCMAEQRRHAGPGWRKALSPYLCPVCALPPDVHRSPTELIQVVSSEGYNDGQLSPVMDSASRAPDAE